MLRRRVLVWVARGAAVAGACALALAPIMANGTVVATLALLVLGLVYAMVSISRRDPVAILTVLVACLLLIPGDQVLVGPLGGFGNPAQLLALGVLVLWAAGRALGLLRARRGHPLRWTMPLFLATTLTAYAAADQYTLNDEQVASTIRWLLISLSFIGLVLLTTDGIDSVDRLEDLLVRFTLIAGVAGLIGIVEYLLPGWRWATAFQVPGFVGAAIEETSRGDFTRVMAAATHPIEYSVVMGALTPVALHLAIHARSAKARRWCKVSFAALVFVTPLSVSRSGLVSLGVGMAFYFVALGLRGRVNLAVIGVLGISVFQVVVPGLISTFVYFFTAGDQEASIAGRTDDYARIPGYLAGNWVFGRGLGTFLPDQYFWLDNQYILTTLNNGLVGAFALVAVIVAGICVARGARHRSGDPRVRGLGQALAGSIAALGASLALFDGLSFRQLSFTLFLLIGCAGALWSIVGDGPRRFPDGRLREHPAPETALVAKESIT
jgi:hypothetical protein